MKTGRTKKCPNDALRFHVIVIDSDVQTRSPYNRITEVGGESERSMKDRSLIGECRMRTKGAEGRP